MKVISVLLFLLFLISIHISHASYSWEQANGPYGGTVNSIDTLFSGELIVGTDNGIFISSDSAETWSLLGLDDAIVNEELCYVRQCQAVLVLCALAYCNPRSPNIMESSAHPCIDDE